MVALKIGVFSNILGLREALECALCNFDVELLVIGDDFTINGDSNPRDIIVLVVDPPKFSSKMRTEFPSLKWIHSTFAGVDSLVECLRGAADHSTTVPKLVVTRSGGVMGPAMAQYVTGWILALERKFFEARHFQLKRCWKARELLYRPMSEITVAILGVGDLGKAVGNVLKVLGCPTIGLKRTFTPGVNYGVDRVSSNLVEVIEKADYIVNVLPSTRETRYLLSDQVLQKCTRSPVLVNVGRGDIIREESIITALNKGWISSAVLDVFEVEPLPENSPLWSDSRVFITPHISANSFASDISKRFASNVQKFVKGDTMDYNVSINCGY